MIVRVRVRGWRVTSREGILDRLVERRFADVALLLGGVIVLLVSRHAPQYGPVDGAGKNHGDARCHRTVKVQEPYRMSGFLTRELSLRSKFDVGIICAAEARSRR